MRGTGADRAAGPACPSGAAQAIITTAAASNISPARAVSPVDLARFVLTTATIVRTLLPRADSRALLPRRAFCPSFFCSFSTVGSAAADADGAAHRARQGVSPTRLLRSQTGRCPDVIASMSSPGVTGRYRTGTGVLR